MIDILANNSNGNKHISGVVVNLVQYTFISANNGVSRTYKKMIHSHKLSKAVGKG